MKLQDRSMITSDDIYRDLLTKIEDLTYMPGDALSENELCAQYNCSRHIVRGAFARLKEMDLLEVYPQRGSFVALLDLDYISDALFIREAVETTALLHALDDAELAYGTAQKLKAVVEQQQAFREEPIMSPEYQALDNEFHNILLDAVGKRSTLALLRAQFIQLNRWRNFELSRTRRVSGLIDEHARIAEALEKRDGKAAVQELHNHLVTVDMTRSALEESGHAYFYRQK